MTARTAHKARPRRRSWIAWLPAMLTIGLGLVTAAGLTMIGSATAASTGTATVQGIIGPDLSVGTCGTVGPTSLTLGSNGLQNVGAACALTFGTNNNAAGVTLTIQNNVATTPFFCQKINGTRNCGSASYPDAAVAGVANPTGTGASIFGYNVTALQGTAPVATSPKTLTTTLYGVAANGSPDTLCQSAATGTSGCTIQFAARTSASQAAAAGPTCSGTTTCYEGVALLTAVAR